MPNPISIMEIDSASKCSSSSDFERVDLFTEFDKFLKVELSGYCVASAYHQLIEFGTFNLQKLADVLELLYYKFLLKNDVETAILFDKYRSSLDITPNTKVKIAYILVRIQQGLRQGSFRGYYL